MDNKSSTYFATKRKKGGVGLNSYNISKVLTSWIAFGTVMPPSHVSLLARLLSQESRGNSSLKRILSDQESFEMNYFRDREEQWYFIRFIAGKSRFNQPIGWSNQAKCHI
jgi:hypothetical protein